MTDDYLAVDTSSSYLAVVARHGGRVAERRMEDCMMQHSVILMDVIDDAMYEAGLRPADCAFFSAVTGPGSFTGIRIGISAMKGMAVGAGRPVLGVTAFETIEKSAGAEGQFACAIDAGRGHLYVCAYDGGTVTKEPCYLTREDTEGLGLPLYGFEDLPLKNYTRIRNDLRRAVEACPRSPGSGMTALYVRKSQAEENRK